MTSTPESGDPLEKGMATHPSILHGESTCTEEPGGLQFIGSQRVRRDSSNLAHMHVLTSRTTIIKMHELA